MGQYPETKTVPCPFCDEEVEIQLLNAEEGLYEAVPPQGHFCGEDVNMVQIE